MRLVHCELLPFMGCLMYLLTRTCTVNSKLACACRCLFLEKLLSVCVYEYIQIYIWVYIYIHMLNNFRFENMRMSFLNTQVCILSMHVCAYLDYIVLTYLYIQFRQILAIGFTPNQQAFRASVFTPKTVIACFCSKHVQRCIRLVQTFCIYWLEPMRPHIRHILCILFFPLKLLTSWTWLAIAKQSRLVLYDSKKRFFKAADKLQVGLVCIMQSQPDIYDSKIQSFKAADKL
jgi:hypothetical protein